MLGNERSLTMVTVHFSGSRASTEHIIKDGLCGSFGSLKGPKKVTVDMVSPALCVWVQRLRNGQR